MKARRLDIEAAKNLLSDQKMAEGSNRKFSGNVVPLCDTGHMATLRHWPYGHFATPLAIWPLCDTTGHMATLRHWPYGHFATLAIWPLCDTGHIASILRTALEKKHWTLQSTAASPRAHTTCTLPRVQHFTPQRYQMSGVLCSKHQTSDSRRNSRTYRL
jgi:hypothetical protein